MAENEKEKTEGTRTRNLVEKRKPNREKNSNARGREKEKREKGRIHEVARAWGRESECERV